MTDLLADTASQVMLAEIKGELRLIHERQVNGDRQRQQLVELLKVRVEQVAAALTGARTDLEQLIVSHITDTNPHPSSALVARVVVLEAAEQRQHGLMIGLGVLCGFLGPIGTALLINWFST